MSMFVFALFTQLKKNDKRMWSRSVRNRSGTPYWVNGDVFLGGVRVMLARHNVGVSVLF
jgi:hypothetical protein